jgi:hypothetical protein
VVGEEEGSKMGASRPGGRLAVVGDGGAEERRVATAGFIGAVVLSSMAMAMAMAGEGCGPGRGAGGGRGTSV